MTLQHQVKYARILKHTINDRSRWFVQMILESKPYRDPKHHTTREEERVGLDFGPSLIAVSTATASFQEPLSGELDHRQTEIRRLQRRLDRSRRATNPRNYQPNGTVKKGRKQWKQSGGRSSNSRIWNAAKLPTARVSTDGWPTGLSGSAIKFTPKK